MSGTVSWDEQIEIPLRGCQNCDRQTAAMRSHTSRQPGKRYPRLDRTHGGSGGVSDVRASDDTCHTAKADAREQGTVLRKNIGAIAELEQRAADERGTADRLSDVISRTTGSAPFALFHLCWFLLWVLINTRIAPIIEPFDPFPFSFLTLVVSLEAIFLSVFVLMSQNRMTRQADKRAHLDLQVDMLAEQELTAILRMVHALCQKQGVEVTLRGERLQELVKETDVHTVAAALDDRLPET